MSEGARWKKRPRNRKGRAGNGFPALFHSPVTIHYHVLRMLNAMRRKEILFPELSYANADHTRLKRWFIRSVEGLSGRDRYARLYDIWRREIAVDSKYATRVHYNPQSGRREARSEL